MTGPYFAIGQLVRQARKLRGVTRRQLVRWIREHPTLEVTTAGAEIMVKELEDLGLVMNTDVLKYILQVVGIAQADVADLLAQAKAASAAEFAEDMKRAAKVIAKDQQRPEGEVLAAMAKLTDLYRHRPMT